MKPYVGAVLAITALAVTACNSSDTQAADRDSAADSTALENTAETHSENSAATANPDPDTSSTATAARPARQTNMNWYLRVDESERSRPAILAYEQPDTDNQPLTMTCEEGGMRVFVGIQTAMPKVTSLTLTAGDVTIDSGGINEPTEMDDIFFFETSEIAASNRFFDEFAKNGWLSYAYYRASTDLVGNAAGDKAVRDFVAHCRGA